MKNNSPKTKVLFRVFQGEILALFPRDAGTCGKPHTCSCYAHIGQHSAADCVGVIRGSRPAKPSEYRDLARELRRIGYKLEIRRRATRVRAIRQQKTKNKPANGRK